jgi:hypothetical protein
VINVKGKKKKMDIDEIKKEKIELEFLIRDSLNAFMLKTKTEVTSIDIGYKGWDADTGLIQILNINLPLVL